MPRLERLEQYAFAVQQLPSGGAEIMLVDDPHRPQHTLVVPLTPDGKRELTRQLTGLIVAEPVGS